MIAAPADKLGGPCMPFRLLALTVLLLAGCHKPQPTIVIDGWWDVDFAREHCAWVKQWQRENASAILSRGCPNVPSCPELSPSIDACGVDPTQQVHDFEDALATNFASDTKCAGIQIIQFKGPKQTPAPGAEIIKRSD